MAYAAPGGKALIDCRLFLTEERAADTKHRQKTYVPSEVQHQEKWRIGLDLFRQSGQPLPHSWVLGDDEFGRATEFREELRLANERYALDVPCHTLVRDLSAPRPSSRPGGRPRLAEFERVDQWAKRQPQKRWKKIRLSGGEKGPREFLVLQQRMHLKDEGGRVGPAERVVVLKSCELKPQTWYVVTNADEVVAVAEVVGAWARRHGVEDLFREGKQEVGLGHYEVRSWTGWHHHMTLSLLALWFLQLERIRLGKKNPGVTPGLVRLIFTELLHELVHSWEPDLVGIARKVSDVLRRTEEARIYSWYQATGWFPPKRPHPGRRPGHKPKRPHPGRRPGHKRE